MMFLKSFFKNLFPKKPQSKKVVFKKDKKQNKTAKKTKNVLMLGWELPPFNSGGLGVACYEMAESLSNHANITFVLPKKQEFDFGFMKLLFPLSKLKIKKVDTILSPYQTSSSYHKKQKHFKSNIYADNLIGEVFRYGKAVKDIYQNQDYDIIHAHDWLSFPAGIETKKVLKKPLVVHVHSTEFDRSHESAINKQVYEIEKMGFEKADLVVAVSQYTKQQIVKYYQINPLKIEVVHNGININKEDSKYFKTNNQLKNLKKHNKIVLFVGRITYQKGVDYLIAAAQKVLLKNPKTVFLIVGSGDMQNQIIEQASELKISDRILFTGFLRGKELKTVYQAADVYVMPSVSEPFGLVALEALSNKVPIIISKQSGVSEVIKNSLKVDFWDVNDLANKIVSILNYSCLKKTLSCFGFKEVLKCNWSKNSHKLLKIYNKF